MTEAELIEAAANFNTLILGWASAYFAAFTAYLVSAYLVGDKLTTSQVLFISGGYSIYSFLCVIAVFGATTKFVEFTIDAEAINPDRLYLATHLQAQIGGVLLFLGILGSLKFMWDIRHPRAN